MTSQSRSSAPMDTEEQPNNRLPDRLCPQPSLQHKSSRHVSNRGYPRVPPLALRLSDENTSSVAKPLTPVPTDGTSSSRRGTLSTPLSPIAAALRESRKAHLNQQSPHALNSLQLPQTLHSPQSPHPQPTRVLSPAHSACLAGVSVELPQLVFGMSKKKRSPMTPPFSPLSLNGGFSSKNSIFTQKPTKETSETEFNGLINDDASYENSSKGNSSSHTALTASLHLSGFTPTVSNHNSDCKAPTILPISRQLTSQVPSSSNSLSSSPLVLTPLVSSSHISSSRGSYQSSRGNIMSNTPSKASTDHVAMKTCRVSVTTPVSQSVDTSCSSVARSSNHQVSSFSHDTPWYATDAHCIKKTLDSNTIASHVKAREETAEKGMVGTQREHTRGRRKIRKKAVVVAISYQDNTSQGTALEYGHAAHKWYDILVRRLDFISDEIRLVTDMPPTVCGNAVCVPPTSAYIMSAMDWLTEDVIPGDRLFFSFNGEVIHHGATDDPCGPPPQFIVPGDFPSGVVVWDDNFHAMVRRVPDGVNMHMVFDCRRSWSIVRLPYIHLPFKMQRRGNFEFRTALTPDSWGTPELATMTSHTIMNFTRAGQEKERTEMERQRNYQQEQIANYCDCANVVCFGASPTRYRKFSFKKLRISALRRGEYSDAFVIAVDQLLRHGRDLTYGNLMMEMAQNLSPPGDLNQTPQICSTHDLDLNTIIPF